KKLPCEHLTLKKYAKLRSPINHGVCVYKKSKVIEVGGYTNLVQMQDYYLFVKMINYGCLFANINKLHLRARVYDNYKRKSGLNYVLEEFYFAKEVFKFGFFTKSDFVKFLLVRVPLRLL